MLAGPPPDQTSLQGHSVGRWEAKTLVVDTTNFSEHANGLSLSMPASAQKRLTERFAYNTVAARRRIADSLIKAGRYYL